MKFLLLLILLSSTTYALQVGNKFPNTISKDIVSNKSINVERYIKSHSKDTLIVFWAIHCPYCLEKLDTLKKYNGPLITFGYGNPDKIKALLKQKQIKYIVLLANDQLFRKYGIMFVPMHFIVHPDMKIKRIE